MKKSKSPSDIRREYGAHYLNEHEIQENPLTQFNLWFNEVLATEIADPTAMVLSTVDEQGLPDSRVVLLKDIDEHGFIFYTNYHSTKSLQLESKPYAALNFYWPTMARQVRIRGPVKRVSKEQSDQYFSSRPLHSQYSSFISQQSHPIENRQVLEDQLHTLIEQQLPVKRPAHWGGYIVSPEEYEFWQGRDNRLHDRIHYYREQDSWVHRRLAP